MAFFARRDRVASDQWQSRDVVIEGHYAAPIVLAVTLLATRAKLALVSILAMARHACGRRLVAKEVAGMAGIALDLRMRIVAIAAHSVDPLVALADMARGARDIAVGSSQREFGFVVVVGLHPKPCGFVMTIVARLPETPFMRIDRLMTRSSIPGALRNLHFLHDSCRIALT